MTSPDDIKAAARKNYERYLSSLVEEKEFFPLELPFTAPKAGEAARRWSELRSEIEALEASSDETRHGSSYTIRREVRNDRLAGSQLLPSGIFFDEEGPYLAYLGKGAEVKRFKDDLRLVLTAFPCLKAWLSAKPQRLVQYAGEWPPILSTVAWFLANSSSGLYLRQIPAVEDTKFIERHKTIIDEILERCDKADKGTAPLAAATMKAAGKASFEERRGLRRHEEPVRLRLLDPRLADTYLRGISDLAIPASELVRLAFPELQTLLILENKTSFASTELFLSLPEWKGALALFGSGYAAIRTAQPWLLGLRLLYWGDIDSHGLRILASMRMNLPSLRSVMMDRETFDHFERYRSNAPQDLAPPPPGLTADELALFLDLAPRCAANRLEQERIPQDYAVHRLYEAMNSALEH